MITVLVLIIFLLGRDLTRKLYKNILASGVSRKEFYLSKIAVLVIIIIFQLITAFAVAFIFGSLFHGLGTMPKNFFWSFSLSFFRSFLFIMTCSSVVTCLLYLINLSSQPFGCFFIAFGLVLHFFRNILEFLEKYLKSSLYTKIKPKKARIYHANCFRSKASYQTIWPAIRP